MKINSGRDIKRIKLLICPLHLVKLALLLLPTPLKSMMAHVHLVIFFAILVLMSEQKVKETGVKPLARIVNYADA